MQQLISTLGRLLGLARKRQARSPLVMLVHAADTKAPYAQSVLSADPAEALERVHAFLAQGYRVHVAVAASQQLLAGPFDPWGPAPRALV